MAWKQLVQPSINISAQAGMCLQYVDNATNATSRTYTAQIAYNTANAKGWVRANQEYPRGVWFVMFWSIDNGEYRGLGHVALAYVGNDGAIQIHDSEVHRNARQPYNSLQELANWFESVGTRLTFLGWSVGCDGTILIEETRENKAKNKGETIMYIAKCVGGDTNKKVKNGTYVLINLARGTYNVINGQEQIDAVVDSYRDATGQEIVRKELNYMTIFNLIYGAGLDYR